jgi:SpoVK/Ycf46/Vps4 family AAA+-type ATPase
MSNNFSFNIHAKPFFPSGVKDDLREKKPIPRKERNRIVRHTNPYILFELPDQIQTLRDLICFAYKYTGNLIDIKKLQNIIPELEELDEMIGMLDLKLGIVEMIMYFTEGFLNKNDDYLHTVICGPPGTGKTHVAQILARIYSGLGILPTDNFYIVKRTDLIGKYLGHTAIKTREKLKECLGGVVFIDEAYSLAPNDTGGNKDSFSKEAIDVLNEFLSEHKNDIVVILGGYKEDLENTIFASNQGLKRRFPWTFNIDSYSPSEMVSMFFLMVSRIGWDATEDSVSTEFFEKYKDRFIHFGGDIETFITKCKFASIKRIFGKTKSQKLITRDDVELAIKTHEKHKKIHEVNIRPPPEHMYT